MEKSMHSVEKSAQQQSCGVVMLFMCLAAVAWIVVAAAQGVVFCATFFIPGFKR